jgi:ABC-2 type transport system ATP-binding protein
MDTRDAPRAVHAKLGYLPDFFGPYDALSVRRCLYYAARAHGLGPGATPRAIEAAARRVRLTDRLEQKAGALSRGLRQRLAIAQAIVHSPAVLLLDEPAAGLDPQARRDLSALLLSLKKEGMTLVVSSHILAELEDYSDRMVIVDHGHVVGGEAIALKATARVRILLAEPRPNLADFLTVNGAKVLEAGEARAVVSLDDDAAARHRLLAALVAAGFAVAEFAEDSRAMEEAYFAQVKN